MDHKPILKDSFVSSEKLPKETSEAPLYTSYVIYGDNENNCVLYHSLKREIVTKKRGFLLGLRDKTTFKNKCTETLSLDCLICQLLS